MKISEMNENRKNDVSAYLSDEELLSLIEDTEKNFDLAAPPDLAVNVISRITAAEEARANAYRLKKAEYRRFCIKVGFAVAAAIAIIIVAPFVAPRLKGEYYEKTGITSIAGEGVIPDKSEALKDSNIPSRDEIVDDNIPSREEILNKKGFTDIIGESHIISDSYNKRNNS